ncbi:MAG: T9SS type A sorting domain-containing protein [Saprospiraceae bacterium]
MKLFLPLFFISLFFSSPLFSQNKIGQIAYAQWNTTEEKWSYHSFDTWNYDDEKREELFYHKDSRYSDYTPTNNLTSSSKYDATGNLIEKNDYHFGPNEWINEIIEYSYNAEQEKIEQLNTSSSSWGDEVRQQKIVFEKDENENRRTTKMFERNDNGNFILKSRQNSFYTLQNCIRKEEIFSFYDNGAIEHGRIWETEYTDNCEIISSRFSRWNSVLETMQELNQYIYEYSNDGKMMITTYLEFEENTNQWETRQVAETEFDNEKQTLRHFVEFFKNNSIDSFLTINTYTSQNEIETVQKFQTQNLNDGRYYKHLQTDSFAYHYDLEDRIFFKEEFIQRHENPVRRVTITYDYYCNGQLKSQIGAYDDRLNYRMDYRYDGGVDCPLDEDGKYLVLFPNPTVGKFTIQSNLLSNSATTIQVFTILGQEIFSEKINQMSYQYQLDLSNFGKGNYIITLSNEQERVSEKLIVF